MGQVPAHLQSQGGAVHVSEVAIGCLGPEDVLSQAPEGRAQPVVLEARALQAGEGQAGHGGRVCGDRL